MERRYSLPSDIVQGHWCSYQRDLRGQVEKRQPESGALAAYMVRPDLADVNVLRGVDEEAPPDDVEPDEEDYDVSADEDRINILSYLTSGVQSSLI